MRITRVYTRVGDQGTTRLVGGSEVGKDDPRIEAYGTVDELNAVLGIVRLHNNERSHDAAAHIEKQLKLIQNELFNVGSDLATPAASRWEGMHRVGETEVLRLESWIDEMNDELEPLREFIIPGGGPVGAHLHLARTVCRRGERRVRTLVERDSEVGMGCITYLNRLSDYLFVLGRWAARSVGESEVFWEKPPTG